MNAERWSWMCAALVAWLGACASTGARVDANRALAGSDVASETQSADEELDEPAPFMRPPRPLVDDGCFYVLDDTAALPRVRYLDGQVSLNESCAIRRGSKLNRKIPPVYVNGRPVGFC